MISQITCGTEDLAQLVCDGMTLRGSSIETDYGKNRFGLRSTPSAMPSSRSMPAPWEVSRRKLTSPMNTASVLAFSGGFCAVVGTAELRG